MTQKAKRYILYFFITVQLVIIAVLGIKIKLLFQDRVKGIQYETDLKDIIDFDRNNKELKYFYEPKPNVEEKHNPEWLGYKVRNTINADTLNERYDYAMEKPEESYRIITLGDSFTYGLYVETFENYPEVLEDLLNNNLDCSFIKQFEVINLGVAGHDIEYSVERLQKRGIKYNPDLLIWLINDWNVDKINEYSSVLAKKLEGIGIPEYDKDSDVYISKRKAAEMLVQQLGFSYFKGYQRDLFDKLANYYKDKILFVSFPSSSAKVKEVIGNFIEDNSKYSFTDQIFDIMKSKKYRLTDGHPNKEGYKEIAQSLYDYITKNFITDCIY